MPGKHRRMTPEAMLREHLTETAELRRRPGEPVDEQGSSRPVAESPRLDDGGVERLQGARGHVSSIWIVLVMPGATVARNGR